MVGNKNKTGFSDVVSLVVTKNDTETGSVADNNMHTSDLKPVLTGNCDLNGLHDNQIFLESGEAFYTNTHICENKRHFINQTGGQFGFVPEPDLKLYTGDPVYWDKVPDIMEAHHIIGESGLPNHLKCRTPVMSTLKPDNWRNCLKEYWDQQLPDFIQYGFPLDFDRNFKFGSTESNHRSPEIHIDQVNPTHTNIFYNLFIPCGVINDPMYIFEDLPI